ncbi:MAG: aminotransferase class III-fold pyridoxal phosphate-dependent enzyme [Chloroflexota bacterium]
MKVLIVGLGSMGKRRIRCLKALGHEDILAYDPREDRRAETVFDEVTSGGIHLKLSIKPDIAVLAKALGNGYPIAAIIGKKEIMEAAQSSFISSTYWTDKIGPVAAIATLKKHKVLDAGTHLIEMGDLVQAGWRELGKRHGLKIDVSGIPPLGHWDIKTENSALLHTIIVERMLERGFLTSKAFYATYTHTPEHVDAYLRALDEVLSALGPYIQANTIPNLPHGPVAHAGFSRLVWSVRR